MLWRWRKPNDQVVRTSLAFTFFQMSSAFEWWCWCWYSLRENWMRKRYFSSDSARSTATTARYPGCKWYKMLGTNFHGGESWWSQQWIEQDTIFTSALELIMAMSRLWSCSHNRYSKTMPCTAGYLPQWDLCWRWLLAFSLCLGITEENKILCRLCLCHHHIVFLLSNVPVPNMIPCRNLHLVWA